MTRMLIAAAFVAAVSSVASAQSAQSVPVTLTEWKVQLSHDTVQAGAVTFRIKNEGKMVHGFHVEGEGVDKDAKEIPAGQSGSLTLTLKPGTYDIYCPMSENTHKMAGMAKKITVVAATKKEE